MYDMVSISNFLETMFLGVLGKCENPEFSKFMKRPCFLGIDLSFLQAGSKTIARGG